MPNLLPLCPKLSHQIFDLQFEADGEQQQGHSHFGDFCQKRPAVDTEPVEDEPGNQVPHQRRQADPAGGGSKYKSGDDPQRNHNGVRKNRAAPGGSLLEKSAVLLIPSFRPAPERQLFTVLSK